MILDAHTACPACAQIVRNVYVTAVRVLQARDSPRQPEYAELFAACESLRPFVEAHHANQVHAFSAELEDARSPTLTAPALGVAIDDEWSQR